MADNRAVPLSRSGPPSVITDELVGIIAGAIGTGVSITGACNLAGISRQTFYEWRRKGEAGHPEFAAFAAAVARAEGGIESEWVTSVRDAAEADWRAAVEMLKRRFPREWGDRIRVETEQERAEFVATVKAAILGVLTAHVEEVRQLVPDAALPTPDALWRRVDEALGEGG